MKKYNYLIKTIKYIIYLLLLFTYSCNKGEDTSNTTPQIDEGLKVSFRMAEITDSELDIIKNSSTKQNINVTLANETQEDFENFSWVLARESADNENSFSNAKTLPISTSKANSVINKLASTRPMSAGYKFRVLIYDTSGKYITSKEITVGSTSQSSNGDITLPPNSTYKYIAYSYYSTQSVPMPDNVNKPEIESRTNATFMYASGDFKLSGTTKTDVPIVFKHMISRIQVLVDARQVYANDFQALNANLDNVILTTHKFNLLNGEKISGSAKSETSSQAIGWVNYYSNGVKSVKISNNAAYTSSPDVHLKVKFTNITTVSDDVLKLVTSARTADFGKFEINKTNHLKRGTLYLKLISSTVVGNDEWTQGNLYYDPSDSNYPYKVSATRTSSQSFENCYYYWNFLSAYPRAYNNEQYIGQIEVPHASDGVKDPCHQLYPKGKYRTPTTQDFRNLVNATTQSFSGTNTIRFTFSNGKFINFWETANVQGRNCQLDRRTGYGDYRSSEKATSQQGYYMRIAAIGSRVQVRYVPPAPGPSPDHAYRGMVVRCVGNKNFKL